jgi:hypothetical protein
VAIVFLVGIAVLAALVGLVYLGMSAMPLGFLRVVATILFFSVFVAFGLGLLVAGAHRAGVQTGVGIRNAPAPRPAPAKDPIRSQQEIRELLLPHFSPNRATIVRNPDYDNHSPIEA